MTTMIRTTPVSGQNQALVDLHVRTARSKMSVPPKASKLLSWMTQGKQKRPKKPITVSLTSQKHLLQRLSPSVHRWEDFYGGRKVYTPYNFPLLVRLGRRRPNHTREIPLPSEANIESMKIINFFHLTPPIVKKQCEALKPLLMPWPDDDVDHPIRIITKDYVFAGNSLRHPNSGRVVMKVNLKSLVISKSLKFMLLAGNSYNHRTKTLTLVGNRCPRRWQNREHLYYTLGKLFQESWRTETFEKELDPRFLSFEYLAPKMGIRLKLRRRTRVVIYKNRLLVMHRTGQLFNPKLTRYGIRREVEGLQQPSTPLEFPIIAEAQRKLEAEQKKPSISPYLLPLSSKTS